MNEDKINENQFQYQLFDTITIIGKISEFRNQRKLHINKISKYNILKYMQKIKIKTF